MIRLTRAGPLTTLQDEGRFGHLGSGVSASGPMDRGAYRQAGALLKRAGATAVEFTTSGIAFDVDASIRIGCAGGAFRLTVNGRSKPWPGTASLRTGDRVEIAPGAAGNYGYLRFDREIAVPAVMGSRATNLTVQLGGLGGRALRAGDELVFGEPGVAVTAELAPEAIGAIRVIWGIHADLFPAATREAFVSRPFIVSTRLDRMGVRLDDPSGVFAVPSLTLVSDAIVAGDIQILGDGTPIVLLRDHQPTGGYPRIATVISADLDRFVQLRPGSEVRFMPVTLGEAQELLR